MPNTRPPTIDPQAAARWQGLALGQSPWLHEEVARRMQERLDWIKLQPQSWLHWEPARGGMQADAQLAARYPLARHYAAQASANSASGALVITQRNARAPWWSAKRWLAAPPTVMPRTVGVQMLWANMALHMAADPHALIRQWHEQLAVDGFLMFSCLGPDTLIEMRTLYQRLGWGAPAHEFTDMHDWGDMLVQSGFAEPVMDMERIVLTFESPERLLQELRELGRNLHLARFAGLRGRAWAAQLRQGLLLGKDTQPTSDGPLQLTFEVIYGHAFKPAPRIKLAAQTEVSLDEMRQALHRPKTRPSSA